MVKLSEAFASGLARKEYVALVRGNVLSPSGVIDEPLQDLQRRFSHLQPAITKYKVLDQLDCSSNAGRAPDAPIRFGAISLESGIPSPATRDTATRPSTDQCS